MSQAFESIRGQVTAQTISDAVPWKHISKVVVVFENEHGDTCVLTSNDAMKSDTFLPTAELQFQHVCLIGRLRGVEKRS